MYLDSKVLGGLVYYGYVLIGVFLTVFGALMMAGAFMMGMLGEHNTGMLWGGVLCHAIGDLWLLGTYHFSESLREVNI